MKKLVSLLSAITVLLSLSACGESSDSSVPAEDLSVSQTMYKEERIPLPDDLRSVTKIAHIGSSGFRLIYLGKDDIYKFVDYSTDLSTSSPVDLFTAELSSNSVFYISENGEISVLTAHISSPHEIGTPEYYSDSSVTYELRCFGSNGAQLSSADVDDMGRYVRFPDDYIQDLIRINDKFIAIANTSRLLIDPNGSIEDAAESQGAVCYSVGSDGKLIVGDFKGYTTLDELTVRIPDELGEYGKFLNMQQGIITGHDGYTSYFLLNNGIYGMTESGSLVQLMSYSDSLLSCNDHYDIVYLDEGRFAAVVCDNNSGKLGLAVLTVRPDDYVMERKDVVLASVWADDHSANMRVNDYNKRSDSYHVTIRPADDFDDLKRSVLTGDAPDIYEFNDTGDMYRLANMGALADMYKLSEQYGGFTKADIMDNVSTAYEYKGGLYMISQTFALSPMIGSSRVFGRSDCTLPEFFDAVCSQPEGVCLTNRLEITDKESLFKGLLSLDQWIDFEKSECRFDTGEFADFLHRLDDVPLSEPIDWDEFYSTTSDEESEIYFAEQRHSLKNGETMLTNGYMHSLSDLDDITNEEQYGLADSDYVMLNSIGQGSANYIFAGESFGIFTNGNCTEGAWDFVNFILSDDYLTSSIETDSCFTVTKSSFAKIMEREQWISKNPDHINDQGEMVHDYRYGRPVTDDEVSRICDYIGNATILKSSHEAIWTIIYEEYAEYSVGETDADTCAERIQNRVAIYLSERS